MMYVLRIVCLGTNYDATKTYRYLKLDLFALSRYLAATLLMIKTI